MTTEIRKEDMVELLDNLVKESFKEYRDASTAEQEEYADGKMAAYARLRTIVQQNSVTYANDRIVERLGRLEEEES